MRSPFISDLDILNANLLPTGASVPDDLVVDFVLGPAIDGGNAEDQVPSAAPAPYTCPKP